MEKTKDRTVKYIDFVLSKSGRYGRLSVYTKDNNNPYAHAALGDVYGIDVQSVMFNMAVKGIKPEDIVKFDMGAGGISYEILQAVKELKQLFPNIKEGNLYLYCGYEGDLSCYDLLDPIDKLMSEYLESNSIQVTSWDTT